MTEVKVKQVEWYDDRWYKITFPDGTVDYFASVTTKLGVIDKPGLRLWVGDVGNETANTHLFNAQERGSRIHHAWETLVTGGKVVYNSPYNGVFSRQEINTLYEQNNNNVAILPYQDEFHAILKLNAFYNEVHPEFVFNEKVVYSLSHKEAGTLDNLVKIKKGKYKINGMTPLELDSGYYVLDVKSGKEVYDENFLQVACYAHCVEEMKLVPKVIGALVLHTSGKTKKGIEGLSSYLRTSEDLEKDYEVYRHVSKVWEYKNSTSKPKVFDFPSIISLGDSAIAEE